MKFEHVIAGTSIERGQFVCERPGGAYFPDPSMRERGGVARKPYAEWPPAPIAQGEEFEMMTDGGCIALVGTKAMWIEVRDGRFRLDLLDPTSQGELRMIMTQMGHALP